MAVKFAQCMREHGLNVPDPEPGKGPMLKFDKSSGVTQEQVEKAMEACQQYNPQGESSREPGAGGERPQVRRVHAEERRGEVPGPQAAVSAAS